MANPGPASTVTSNYILNGDASDGALVGGSAANKVGFYGATPIVQQAAIVTIATNATGTAISVAVNSIITSLKNLGLTA
jgi:homospermidine synthase